MVGIDSIYLVCIGAAIIGVVGFWVTHRVIKPINLDQDQGFLDAMLNIVGTLVSILLGLLVAAALDHYRSLEQTVDTEAASVAQVYRLTYGLPTDTQKKIQQLCADYCDQVINDEWPAMAHGQPSRKVFITYLQLVNEIATYQPDTNGETNIHSALISAMQQIGDSRRQRILVLRSAWSQHLMPVLIMCAAIVLAFAYLYVRRGALLHGVLICFVAIALGGNLGLVFLLSNPFSGDWKIQPTGFILNTQILHIVNSEPELQKLLQNLKE